MGFYHPLHLGVLQNPETRAEIERLVSENNTKELERRLGWVLLDALVSPSWYYPFAPALGLSLELQVWYGTPARIRPP